MAYRSRRSRSSGSVGQFARQNTFTGKNYVSESSGARRHSTNFTLSGTPSALLPGEYIYAPMLQFQRTFTAGTDDVEPTPTASNNYQDTQVMNGSKIGDFKALIKIANQSSTQGGYLDIYTVAVSFYDILIWNTVLPSACPLTFDTTTVSPGDRRGVPAYKAISSTLITENGYKNYKFVQHYMKKLGTVYLSASDGGKPNAEIILTRVPAKCRRSQTGMLYAIFFHNDSAKNAAATLALDATIDLNFKEYPSSNRLPYIT